MRPTWPFALLLLAACGARTAIHVGGAALPGTPGLVDAGDVPAPCIESDGPIPMPVSGATGITWDGTVFAVKYDIGSEYGIRTFDASGRATGDHTTTRTNMRLVDTFAGLAAIDIQDGSDPRLRRYDPHLHELGHTPVPLDSLLFAGFVDDGPQLVAFGYSDTLPLAATRQAFDMVGAALAPAEPLDTLPERSSYPVSAVRTSSGYVAVYSREVSGHPAVALGLDDALRLAWRQDLDVGTTPTTYAVFAASRGGGFFAWAQTDPDATVTTVRAFEDDGVPSAAPVTVPGTHFALASHDEAILSARVAPGLHVQPLASDATPAGADRLLASAYGFDLVRVFWTGSRFAVVYIQRDSPSSTTPYLQYVCP